MNYEEALKFISVTHKFGMELGLENITKLMAYLGNPQDRMKFVHVAGTNGKGSTAAMITNVLIHSGYRTGLYISPFLEECTERIQIDNVQIKKQDFADATQPVKDAVERMVADGCEHPTEFEIITAIALVYYAKQNVDIIVFEVGLGGRLDATNVISDAEVAVIASISFDHTAYLGNTIASIAAEKAGIIKENYDVSLYCCNDQEANEAIQKVADEKHAHIYKCDINDITVLKNDIDGQVFQYTKKDSVLGINEFKLALIGEHQKFNVLNALNALEILKKKGWNITSQAVLDGLAQVHFNGRFEIMHRDPIIVIDGGHNIEGITSFVGNIKKYFAGKKVRLFYGMLNDKQVDESLALLTKIADEIFTLTPQDPRAVPAEEMSAFIREHYPNIPTTPLEEESQIAQHIDFSEKDRVYAFTGSLYMIGNARTALRKLIREHDGVELQ